MQRLSALARERLRELERALTAQRSEQEVGAARLAQRGQPVEQRVDRLRLTADALIAASCALRPRAQALCDPRRFCEDGTLLVVVGDPTDEGLLEVSALLQHRISYAVGDRTDVLEAWRRLLNGYR